MVCVNKTPINVSDASVIASYIKLGPKVIYRATYANDLFSSSNDFRAYLPTNFIFFLLKFVEVYKVFQILMSLTK